jgi:hypothetical protein
MRADRNENAKARKLIANRVWLGRCNLVASTATPERRSQTAATDFRVGWHSRTSAQGCPEKKFRHIGQPAFLTHIFQDTRLSAEVKMALAYDEQSYWWNNLQHGAPAEANNSLRQP